MKNELLPSWFNNLEKFATRPQTLQRDEIVGLIWCNGAGMRIVSIPFKEGIRSLYFEKTDAKESFNKIIIRLLEDYKKHIQEYKKSVQSIDRASKTVEKSITLSNKKKALAFGRWLRSLEGYYIPIVAPFAIEDVLDQRCRFLLKEEFSEDYEKMFEVISSPIRLNEYQEMRIELINLVLSEKINQAEFEELEKKYNWYSEYSYVEPLLDKEYFTKEALRLGKETALEEKKRILGQLRNNKKLFFNIQKKIRNNELKLIVKIINDYTFFRTQRLDYLKKAQVKIRKLLIWIAQVLTEKTDYNWELKDVANFSNNEIINFLEKNEILDRRLIKKRLDQQYIYYNDGLPHILYDTELIVEAKSLVDISEPITKEIKGLVASRGIAKGKVVIVLSKVDLSKVKKGDILIAKTTMPDYTIAMGRASAIITEEGGITSHAAIVSRELGIPCIVGTKIATKVFKDGDYIEVDANKGIVRKIK